MFEITQRTLLAAAILAATTGTALAQSIDPAQVAAEVGEPHGFGSTLSSAEVRSQAVAAVAAGQTARGELGAPEAASQSSRNRAEVKAEAVMAVKSGQVQRGEAG